MNGLKPSSADASGVSLSTSNSVPSQTALSRPTASHTSATMTNVTATTGTPYAGTTLKKDFKAPPPMTNQPKRIFPRRIPGRASASRSSSISADHGLFHTLYSSFCSLSMLRIKLSIFLRAELGLRSFSKPSYTRRSSVIELA